MRRALAVALALSSGCSMATTSYTPQVVARGELTLRYDQGFEMWAGGRKVASSWSYGGLSNFVRCVPEAQRQARAAERDGRFSVMMSVVGAVLGSVVLAGGITLAGALGTKSIDTSGDSQVWPWVGGGLGAALVATMTAGMARLKKNSANGHAVDAMNFYNDAVGSLGATCDDLRYPPPAMAEPPPQEMPPPPGMPPPPPESGMMNQ